MAIPRIDIHRHNAYVYEWEITLHEHSAANDAGYTSVTDSLDGALGALRASAGIVELRYNGIHIGTYLQSELRGRVGQVADDMVSRHAQLTRS